MAIVESIACVKVRDKYTENVEELEDYEQLMMNESCTYLKIDTDQRSTPQLYNTILKRSQDKNAEDKELLTRQQPSKATRQRQQDEPYKAPKEKPSNYLVLATSALFICICCWPAAPCAILATIYSIQVSHLWKAGHHEEAKEASGKAKKLAMTALVCGGINMLTCVIINIVSILIALGTLGYFSEMIYIKS